MQNVGIPGFVSISGLVELTAYDKIVFTDANTRTIAGERMTACCSIEGRFVQATKTCVRFELTDPSLRILELRGPQGNPEMLAILQDHGVSSVFWTYTPGVRGRSKQKPRTCFDCRSRFKTRAEPLKDD